MSRALSRPRIVAHRGASFSAPENTMAAFRRAWALGCEAIELDVHVTRDGHPVVIHDPSLTRTAGVSRLVVECTLEELRALDVGAWKDAAFAGERIATLAEVLEAAPAGTTVFVEIKASLAATAGIAAALQASVARRGDVALALQSFDLGVLTAMSAALPEVSAYWTVGAVRHLDETLGPYPHVIVERARALGLAGLALDARAVAAELLEVASAAGILIDVWTVNDAAALRTWGASAVRWIETDCPELAGC